MIDLPDPELIAAHLAGDRAAFAALYDRYAPSLYDVARQLAGNPDDAADLVHDTFVIAAQRLGQLRDRERLRPWLFAVLRHERFRTGRRRGRERPTDRFADVAARQPDPGDAIDGTDLATLVRDAAAGLDERDRLVLELVARQRLEGADLAAALGVTVAQTYSMVHRMRQRFARAAGAVVVARTGRRSCASLDGLLAGWDGTYDVLTRKRVARHVDECDACGQTRQRAGLLELFTAAPASAMPAGLRDRVLADAATGAGTIHLGADGFPRPPRRARRASIALAAVLAVLLVAGVAATLGRSDGSGRGDATVALDAARRPADGAGPVVDVTTPAAGAAAATGPGTAGPATGGPGTGDPSDPGPGGAGTTAAGGVGPAGSAAPPTGSPGADATTAPPSATTAPPTGPGGATTAPDGSGTAPTATTGAATRTTAPPPARTTSPTTGRSLVAATTTTTVAPPTIRIGDPASTVLWTSTLCTPTTVVLRATVLDAAAGVTVTLSWTGPAAGATGRVGMVRGADGAWTATIGPFTAAGTVGYVVSARNPGGPAAATTTRTLTVRTCTR